MGQGQKQPNLDTMWMNHGSPPSLKDCYKLWCDGEMDKEVRNTFVSGEMIDIRIAFDSLMTYCAKDCLVTHEVFSKSLSHFRKMCPHPATFAGMLEMGTVYVYHPAPPCKLPCVVVVVSASTRNSIVPYAVINTTLWQY